MTGTNQRKEKELGPLKAIWNAFCGWDVSHYPRFLDQNGKERKIEDKEIIRKIESRLDDLKEYNVTEIDFFLRRGREGLDEVKELTEYQDQKAARNLTIITFLSALAGVLFARFADSYPLRTMINSVGLTSVQGLLVSANYLLFFVFAVCAASGALVVFHATRIRFKYPTLTTMNAKENTGRTKSYLFYNPIIQISPERWAESFLDSTESVPGRQRALYGGLGLSYLSNYIVESYLVAGKAADKLRYLMPAQRILSLAIRVLLVWLFVYALAVACVPVLGEEEMVPPPPAVVPSVSGQGTGVGELRPALPPEVPGSETGS